MDLDLLPIAKKYSQLIQIRYPENTYYTYQPALAICIAEGRYEDALDLTIIWAENKGLDKMLAAEKIARIHYLKGDRSIAEQILMMNFADLFQQYKHRGSTALTSSIIGILGLSGPISIS